MTNSSSFAALQVAFLVLNEAQLRCEEETFATDDEADAAFAELFAAWEACRELSGAARRPQG